MLALALALIIFLFPLAYSPGPGNMFFAANAARFGFRSTLGASLGYHIATWIVTAIIGLGFMTTLEHVPALFFVLKLAGSAYVLWIAWTFLRAGTLHGAQTAKPASVWDGAVLLVLNPKAYVIIALMFTQFLDQSRANLVFEVIFITTLFTINNWIAFTLWSIFGDKVAAAFRSPDHAKRLNLVFAGVLAGVALWMLIA